MGEEGLKKRRGGRRACGHWGGFSHPRGFNTGEGADKRDREREVEGLEWIRLKKKFNPEKKRGRNQGFSKDRKGGLEEKGKGRREGRSHQK